MMSSMAAYFASRPWVQRPSPPLLLLLPLGGGLGDLDGVLGDVDVAPRWWRPLGGTGGPTFLPAKYAGTV
jgi:hypothetical protein